MWDELFARLSPIFLPIFTGIAMGVVSRGRFDRPTERRMAKICEDAALKLFLPFFVIESIARSTPSYDLALAFVIGFMLPLLALVGMALYKRVMSHKATLTPHYDDLRFLVSSYGGGNRGTALFLLLFAGSASFGDYLTWFSLVDLGNFACLLIVISTLLSKQYGVRQTKEQSVLARLLDNYAFVTAFIVLAYFGTREYWPSVETTLAQTVQARKFLFSFLVFLAITFRFESGVLRNFFADLLAFLSARIFTALCATLMLAAFLPDAVPIVLAVIVLVAMPPSSFIPAMIGHTNASKETVGYVNGFTGAANVLYLGLIAIGIVVAVSQAVNA